VNGRRRLVSVVVPVYFNASSLPAAAERFRQLAKDLRDYRFEFLFVDDGSADESWPELRRIVDELPGARALRLARNFGSHMATLAGYEACRGDLVVHVNADLQEPPELIARLLEAQERTGCDVVLAARESRPEGRANRLFARLYYGAVRRWILPAMPVGGTDCYLLTRKALATVLAAAEANTSLPGLVLWSGHSLALVPYDREARHSGRSRWTLAKKIKLLVDTVVSFSYLPVRLMIVTGLLVGFASFGYAGWIIVRRLLLEITTPGWSSLMVVVLLLGGIQMIFLGLLGEYLWRTYEAARSRPLYVVDEVYEAVRGEGDASPPA